VSTSPVADSGPLAVLSAGAAALARATDLDTALAVIIEAGAAAVGATVATVFGQDAESGNLELLATLGMDEAAIAILEAEVAGDPAHPIHRAALDRIGALGRGWLMPDGETMTVADLPLVVADGTGTENGVGVLSFGWPGSHDVGTEEETLLVGAADLVAAAISAFRTASMVSERAEWLQRISHMDALTALANARTLARVLELEVARAQRQSSEVSVAVFDIDGFTALNDAAGSRAGDLVLRHVAAILAESVRLVDTIARTGGDEFVLVAPGSAGVTVARRVLDGIARLEAVEGHVVTASAGVARFPQDGASAEELLAAARAALEASDERAAIVEAART
jgi:diguanylate cyclase (GGDEF)-like protein